MKTLLLSIFSASIFVFPAMAIEPLPNSITANGPTATALAETPVGSVMLHELYYRGNRYVETYVVGVDQRLELVNRTQKNG